MLAGGARHLVKDDCGAWSQTWDGNGAGPRRGCRAERAKRVVKIANEKAPASKSYMSREVLGGAEGNRTPDLLIANEALYHLSYGPKERRRYGP